MDIQTVNVRLEELLTNLKRLLSANDGCLLLARALSSYETAFSPISVASDAGVSFEHLISCLKEICITKDVKGSKFITLNKENSVASPVTAPLQDRISLLSNELYALIKFQPNFKIPLDQFSARFMEHFGRELKTNDYGYSKLEDLLEAIPNVAIIGEARGVHITLSHSAQVRRFTTNLLRVLRSQQSKQAQVTDLPDLIAGKLGSPFNVYEYGVCDIEDMLLEIPATTVGITSVEGVRVASIPKKEESSAAKADETIATEEMKSDTEPKTSKQDQAQDKVERIHQFAKDCVLLLKHKTDCRIPLNLFIHSFQEYFGRVPKLSDFGSKKVSQLIQAVPGVLEITGDPYGQSFVQLTDSARLSDFKEIRVSPQVQVKEECDNEQKTDPNQEELTLAQRCGRRQFQLECVELLRATPEMKMPLTSFAVKYHHHFKRQCKLADYGASKLINLFMSMPDILRVTEYNFGERIIHLKTEDAELDRLDNGEENAEIESEKIANSTMSANDDSGEAGTSATAKSLISYDRDKLLELASSPQSLKEHMSLVVVFSDFPILKRRSENNEGDTSSDAIENIVGTDIEEVEHNEISKEDILNGVKSLNFKKLLGCTSCKLIARTPARSCGDGHSI